MVYCSQCGIQNRDGSKFCNNCGARLASEQGLRCPMCSTLNQVETVFCSNCGARLAPLVAAPLAEPPAPPAAPIKGLSLPARSVTATVEEAPPQTETPGEPASTEPVALPTVAESPNAQETSPIEEGQVPSWIARLRSITPAESAEDDGTSVEEIPDWLKPPPAETAPATHEPASSEAPGNLVPSWLSSLETPAVESQPVEQAPTQEPLAQPTQTEDELPDWLRQPAVDSSPAPSAPTLSEDGLPDWLRTGFNASAEEQMPMAANEPEPVEPEKIVEQELVEPMVAELSTPPVVLQETLAHETVNSETPGAMGEMPDWLRDAVSVESAELIATPPAQTQEPQIETLTTGEIPVWLREPTFIEPAKPIVTPPAQTHEPQFETLTTGEIPVWLREPTFIEPAKPIVTPPAQTQQPQIETLPSGEIPAWVAALKPKDADLIAPSFTGETPHEPIEPGEIPAWLAAMRPQAADTQPLMPAYPQAEESVLGELPTWLTTSETKPADESTASPKQPTQEEPALGEIPAWVAALKPKDVPAIPQIMEEALAPFQGAAILSDLQGILPLASAITQPHASRKLQRVIPAQQREGALVFESLLASTAEPAAVEIARPKRRLTMRPFIYLLLLVAVLVPFIVPMDSVVRITQVPAEEFFNLVNARVPNAPVVVSFDYDPGTAGEMDLLAKAVVRHLIQNGTKIVAVSTLETGPQVAQRVMSAIEQENGKTKYGSDYVIVYLPSNEVSLSQLATSGLPTKDYKNNSIDAFLASANLKTLRNAALIIELAGRDDRLKMWMEQVQPRTGVKMAAAVSAAVEPKARAYRGSNQLAAMMSGLLGAAQYEALTLQSGQSLIAVNAQSLAQIALVLIIGLGNLAHLISRARGQAA